MATSAFKSTTQRTPIAKTSTSNNQDSSSSHRRSRSLSRFPRRLPAPASDDFSDETPPSAPPTGRFVNTMRGSGFPEISLDDLAIEFFDSPNYRGRSGRRGGDGDVSFGSGGGGGGASLAERRGRSVSRQGSKGGSVGNSSGGGRANLENNSRRRRSVSVVRYQISDSESDLDHSQNSSNRANLKRLTDRPGSISGSSQKPLSYTSTASNHRQGLRRSVSQKDLKYHDDYSSQSSALTDEEVRDIHSDKNGIEKTIRAVYAQKKADHPTGDDVNSGLYEAMRKEIRHAMDEIRMELEQAATKTKSTVLSSDDCLRSKSSDVLQAVSTIKRSYATKLEQSVKRKQDLLAEIVLEEQRGRELSKIVKDLLPDPENTVVEKPPRTRKRSNDRSRMSKRLTEEAEKYIEDFISNVEDTDISSIDGERSDTSSSLGGMAKTEAFQSPAASKSLPVEMDGVMLPWLQWETTNDASPLSCKNNSQPMVTPKNKFWNAVQEATTAQDLCNHSTSSHGSWSPRVTDGLSMNVGEDTESKFGEPGSYQSKLSSSGARIQFDVDEYLKRETDEDFLFERLRQQRRINSGCLLLCNQMFF